MDRHSRDVLELLNVALDAQALNDLLERLGLPSQDEQGGTVPRALLNGTSCRL